jgi:uncharacterized membrane protein YqjE
VAQGVDDSVIRLAREIADEGIRMVRADIELAKKELSVALKRVVVSAALLTVAGVFLLIAVVEGLGAVPVTFGPTLFGSNPWLPWVALGGVFLVLALLVALLGIFGIRKAVRGSRGLVDTLKEDAQWAKRLTQRGKSTS